LGLVTVPGLCALALWPRDPLRCLYELGPLVDPAFANPSAAYWLEADSADKSHRCYYLQRSANDVTVFLKKKLFQPDGWQRKARGPWDPDVEYTHGDVSIEVTPLLDENEVGPTYQCRVTLARKKSGFERWWYQFRLNRGWIKEDSQQSVAP
jgi:hypothetical protein